MFASSALVFAELAILLVAAFLLWLPQTKISTAIAYAILSLFATLSFIYQSVFLLGVPQLAFAVELVLVVAAVRVIVTQRYVLAGVGGQIGRFLTQNRIAIVFAAAAVYLFVLGWLIPPSNPDSLRYHLLRVLLYQQNNSPFLDVVTPHQAHRAVFPIGSDILFHSFLRFYTDYGLAFFSFLSYIGIGAALYSIGCSVASRRVAMTTVFITLSLPLVVYQASSTKNDIVIAFVAIVCFLAAARLYNNPSAPDLLLLIVASVYGISVKTLFLGFLGPFGLCFGFILLRRYPLSVWQPMILEHRQLFGVLLIPLLVLSQVWLFLYNLNTTGSISGPAEFVQAHSNLDGLVGASANSVRYFLQSLDILKVVDLTIDKLLGSSTNDWLFALYTQLFYPVFGDVGTNSTFQISTSISEGKSWFGPLSFLLFYPAVGYALFRGGAFVRAVALSVLGYGAMVAWQLPWMPWNNRFFSLWFVVAAVCLAFLLQQKADSMQRLNWISRIAMLLVIYACLFNSGRPILPIELTPSAFVHGLVEDNVWAKTDFGRQRTTAGFDTMRDDFATRLPQGETVRVIMADTSNIYHLMMARPDLDFQIVSPQKSLAAADRLFDVGNARYFFCTDLTYCSQLNFDVWSNEMICYSDEVCLYFDEA